MPVSESLHLKYKHFLRIMLLLFESFFFFSPNARQFNKSFKSSARRKACSWACLLLLWVHFWLVVLKPSYLTDPKTKTAALGRFTWEEVQLNPSKHAGYQAECFSVFKPHCTSSQPLIQKLSRKLMADITVKQGIPTSNMSVCFKEKLRIWATIYLFIFNVLM